MDHDRPVGALLREWRTRRGLSQLELSIRCGISSRHVSFVETGRTIPSPAMLERFAEAYQMAREGGLHRTAHAAEIATRTAAKIATALRRLRRPEVSSAARIARLDGDLDAEDVRAAALDAGGFETAASPPGRPLAARAGVFFAGFGLPSVMILI